MKFRSKPYANLYSDQRWPILAKRAFKRDGYQCKWHGCGKMLIGKAPAHNSPVAHHKLRHKGDTKLFFDFNNIMSVCKQCHDGPIQMFEKRGYIKGHTSDGRPLDPNHPWNAGAVI